jgi:hypothetical protein
MFFNKTFFSYFIYYSYESDRTNNSGSARNYRDTGYQQQRGGDNYNNQQPRRSNNYPTGNGNRGRRGSGANSYRGDANSGGTFNRKRNFVGFSSFFFKRIFVPL